MSTKQEIAQIVAVISAGYPNFSVSPHTVEVYYQVLSDLDYEELRIATMQSLAETGRKFAPSVGEIRGSVLELRKQIMNVPSSYQAWQEVLKQASNVGSYGTPVFSHPVIEQAVKTLGWRNICLSEDATADRARFIMAYDQLSERAERDLIALPEVKRYIVEKQSGLLSSSDVKIKQLVKGMEK